MIAQIASFAWLGPLGDHLWQSTMFFLLTCLLVLALHKRSARVRHSLWIAASLKFFVPFSLLVALGTRLPVPSAFEKHPRHKIPANVVVASQPFSAIVPTYAQPMTATHDVQAAATAQIALAMGFIWFIGFSIILFKVIRSHTNLRTLLRHAVPVACGREKQLLQKATSLPHLHNRFASIPLLLSDDSVEPAVIGVWKPRILWPVALSPRLNDEEMQTVLAHEVAHIVFHDNLVFLLHSLVEAVFWFHPSVWFIGRKLLEERELACDQDAGQAAPDRSVYAEALLQTARLCVNVPSPGTAGLSGGDLGRRIVTLMSGQVRPLGIAGKCSIASLLAGVALAPLAYGLIQAMPALGQVLHAEGRPPEFAVVSVRPSSPDSLVNSYSSVLDGFEARNATVKDLIAFAYGVGSDNEVSGGPSWIGSDKFDVRAKLDSAELEAYSKLSREDRDERVRFMVQALLGERFGLQVKFEKRSLPVFELVLTKAGPKCTKRAIDTNLAAWPKPRYRIAPVAPPPPPPGWIPPSPEEARKLGQSMHMKTKDWPFWLVVTQISHQPELHGRTVIDKTGLTGSYDCEMIWSREGSGGTEPSFFVALQESMGMKMIPANDPVEIVVVDSAKKPTSQDQS